MRAIFTRNVVAVCLFAFLILPVVAADEGNVTVFQGDSITVQDANWTLTWGQDYTFDRSGSAVYSDAYYMNMTDGSDRNISVTSDTPAWINTTLWEYDFDDLSFGDELIRLEVEADPVSTVEFLFTGVPSPGDHKYEVAVGGETIEEFSSDGALSWSYSDWSTKNFTVTYAEVEEEDDDDGTTTGPSPSPAPTLPDHCWSGVDTAFIRDDPASGLTFVGVDMVADVEGPCLGVDVLSELPDTVPVLDDVYRYYNVTPEEFASDEVEQVNFSFTVNHSFAGQYDDIVMSRYGEMWVGLPTTQVDDTGDVWEYEATADGFSYFGVHGIDEEYEEDPVVAPNAEFTVDLVEPGVGETVTFDAGTSDVEGEVISYTWDFGDGATATGETVTHSYDEPGVYEVTLTVEDDHGQTGTDTVTINITDTDPDAGEAAPVPDDDRSWLAVFAAVLLIVLVAGTGMYAYRNGYDISAGRNPLSNLYTHREEGMDADVLREEVMELIEEKGVRHQEFINTKLKQAEFALENNLDSAARHRLEEIKEHLEQD